MFFEEIHKLSKHTCTYYTSEISFSNTVSCKTLLKDKVKTSNEIIIGKRERNKYNNFVICTQHIQKQTKKVAMVLLFY
jgi:hypothetical protein